MPHSDFWRVIITPKNAVKVLGTGYNPFYGVTLTPILTPNLGSFLLLKKSSFKSENGVNFTPYMGCFNSFWSFFNSESGVNILGTGKLLLGGYFNSSISGVIFTPEKEFFIPF